MLFQFDYLIGRAPLHFEARIREPHCSLEAFSLVYHTYLDHGRELLVKLCKLFLVYITQASACKHYVRARHCGSVTGKSRRVIFRYESVACPLGGGTMMARDNVLHIKRTALLRSIWKLRCDFSVILDRQRFDRGF